MVQIHTQPTERTEGGLAMYTVTRDGKVVFQSEVSDSPSVRKALAKAGYKISERQGGQHGNNAK